MGKNAKAAVSACCKFCMQATAESSDHSQCILVLLMQVDPSIMGGMVVDIGDKHIDMSISARVKKVQQLIMQTM